MPPAPRFWRSATTSTKTPPMTSSSSPSTRSWGRVKSRIHPVAGNHEYQTAGAAGYFDYFNGVGNATGPAGDRGKGYYSYEIGSWHVIALNSNCAEVGGCGAGSPQEQWLRSDLAAHPSTCTLAYWHHPLFSSGPAWQHPVHGCDLAGPLRRACRGRAERARSSLRALRSAVRERRSRARTRDP